MGKIDLSKDVNLKDIKNINIKKPGSKKNAVLPSKKGINLMQVEKKKTNKLAVGLISLVAVVALALVGFYGVYKPMSALNVAKAEYEEAHAQYEITQATIGDYDAVLAEYHTYSREWMASSGQFNIVPREEVLEMVDTLIEPRGTLSNVSLSGNKLYVNMSEMSLPDVTEMIADIEKVDFVSYAFLHSAVSQPTEIVTINEEGEKEVTVGPEHVIFSITINLQNVEKENDA